LTAQSKQARAADRDARRAEKAQRVRIARRHEQGEWPLDATTLDKAELEPGDVRMPLPPEPPPLTDYRAIAESAQPLDQHPEAERTLVIARWHERERERAKIAALRGPVWTTSLVDERLGLAMEIELRSGGRLGPRQYGSVMPTPRRDLGDLVAAAENGSLRHLLSKMLRYRVVYSGEDIRRANEAITWVAEYLADERDREIPLFVNAGALWRATHYRIQRACTEYGLERSTFYRKRKLGLERIVEGLIGDRRAPL
jgi:hypothetical protein